MARLGPIPVPCPLCGDTLTLAILATTYQAQILRATLDRKPLADHLRSIHDLDLDLALCNEPWADH